MTTSGKSGIGILIKQSATLNDIQTHTLSDTRTRFFGKIFPPL